MKKFFILIFLLSVTWLQGLFAQSLLADPQALPEVVSLYNSLLEVQKSGQVLLGHHDALAYGHAWRDELGRSDVKDIAGSHPAICSVDFGKIEHGASININRVPFDKMREVIQYAHRRKQVILICWHVDNPKTYAPGSNYPAGTSWDNSDTTVVKEILQEGSPLNIKFKGWMDLLAEYILTLKDDDGKPIPFIFRPWHEHTQTWSWWGAKCTTDEEFVEFWKFTIRYLRDTKGLHQMMYAISPQMDNVYPQTKERLTFRWPGDEYVDFIGIDCYHGRRKEAFVSNVKHLTELAAEKNKPCGVTETGIEGVPYPQYFTEEILPVLEDNNLSMVVFWRNDDRSEKHHYVSYKGHNSEADFLKFCQSPTILLENDWAAFRTRINQPEVPAQITQATLLTRKPELYAKTEFDIRLTAGWENPYLQEDVALDMFLIAPSGKKLTLPCYYESGESGQESIWKARFTPQETGNYQYSFKLTKRGQDVSSSPLSKFNVAKSKRDGFLHVKDFWTMQFDSGKPFRGVGENICWESRANDDSRFFKELHEQPKYNYDYLLSSLAASGGNYYRTWMCSWNLPIDRKRNFNNNRYTASEEYYNPSAVQRFEHMVHLCDSLQLYVMLTLGQGENLSGAAFFADESAKAKYKNRLRYIVARWGYSTNIGAWEFFNEVDNVQFRNANNPIDGALITRWHDEMSRYLKQIDPYGHIVTTSISHRDVEGLNAVAELDINQKHIYRNTLSIIQQINQYTNQYKKPYVIGEFSFEWDWSKNFNDFADDMDIDFKRGLWYGMFTPTPILPMSWWWEFFDNRGMTAYFKGVREINDKMLAAGKGAFEKIPVEAGKLEAYGVQCGKTIFVYLFNPTQATLTEDLTVNVNTGKSFKGQRFDPNTCKYQNVTLQAGNAVKGISLDAKNEMVYILTQK